MKQILTLVVAVAVIFSSIEFINGQQWQQSQQFQRAPSAQVASLPPGAIANLRNRQWHAWNTTSQSRGQMVAQNFNDGLMAPAASPVTYQNSFTHAPDNYGANSYYPQTGGDNTARSSLYVSPGVANSGPGSYGTGSWQMGGGYTPYVMGDIFGVGRYDYCDEWANLCPCLELTNGRSNCECTNPHRTKLSDPCRHGFRTNQASCPSCSQGAGGCTSCSSADAGCQDCARSAKRSSVSEYFHPERYR